ncbi:MAG TPA: TetR/AcrR family transcriptional regulator [Acidimicrobiales bacterium]|nr:TetR/AcrR family transcriptional regulator [Acidimicrobiales bacterium]
MARSPIAPRKRPRQQRSRETVARILDAAAEVFAEHGSTATTTHAVAERAGVSIGSLYQYLPNKEALLVALSERHLDDAATRLGPRLVELRDREPDVTTLAEAMVDLAIELNDDPAGLHHLLFTAAPRTPEVLERFDALIDVVVAEAAHHLRRLGVGGADPDLRARVLVHAVDAAIHEVVLPLTGAARDAARAEVVALVRRGVGAT